MTSSKTATYLKNAIETSGLTQREIARRAGFETPNMISMMKTGDTKVPIDRIPALADALGVPALEFLRVAMIEYDPGVWDVLTRILGGPLTRNEELLLFALDVADPDGRIVFDDANLRLVATIFDHMQLEAKLREDVGDAYDSEPSA
jgi:transcriptional regulator with XRE-family HTH domain